jgi:hypothetical protein
MIQQYHVQLGSLYLTSDGMTGGTKYLVEVDGIDSLMDDYVSNEQPDMRGNLIVTLNNVEKKSKPITLNLLGITFQLASDLKALKNTQDSTHTATTMVLTHPYNADFTFELDVNITAVRWKGFFTQTWRDVEIVCRTFGEA